MRRLISWLLGRSKCRRVYEKEVEQVIDNIPTYVPGKAATAVLIVQADHFDSLPASVVAIRHTSLCGVMLVEVNATQQFE